MYNNSQTFLTLNPATNERLEAYNYEPFSTISQYLTQQVNSDQVDLGLSRIAVEELSSLLSNNSEKLSRSVTLEMGKPISQSRAEVQKCIELCEYYGSIIENISRSKRTIIGDKSVQVANYPDRTTLVITPWNYPVWQAIRSIVPILLLGGSVLHKPAPSVFGTTEILGKLITAVFGSSTYALGMFHYSDSERVISDTRIGGVIFTGSSVIGSTIAGLAGKHLKKTVLELGGADAFLIFPGANLQSTTRYAVRSRLKNSGQSCLSSKRFIVHKDVQTEFLNELLRQLEDEVVGDPLDVNTTIGPMANQRQTEKLVYQYESSILEGAISERVLEREGNFLCPAVLNEVPANTRCWTEETFGPVFTIKAFDSPREMFTCAEETKYGLAATICCSPGDQAVLENAKSLNVGNLFFNMVPTSHPSIPFGGTKESGYGRELGEDALFSFQNQKAIFGSFDV